VYLLEVLHQPHMANLSMQSFIILLQTPMLQTRQETKMVVLAVVVASFAEAS